MKNKKSVKTMKLGTFGPEATPKVEQGSLHALRNKPVSLLNANSDQRRILGVLYQMGGAQTSKEVCRLFNQRYKTQKTSTAISARLSELFTVSLVDRFKMHGNKGKLLYRSKADLNIADGEALYETAVKRQQELKDYLNGVVSHCVMPVPHGLLQVI